MRIQSEPCPRMHAGCLLSGTALSAARLSGGLSKGCARWSVTQRVIDGWQAVFTYARAEVRLPSGMRPAASACQVFAWDTALGVCALRLYRDCRGAARAGGYGGQKQPRRLVPDRQGLPTPQTLCDPFTGRPGL